MEDNGNLQQRLQTAQVYNKDGASHQTLRPASNVGARFAPRASKSKSNAHLTSILVKKRMHAGAQGPMVDGFFSEERDQGRGIVPELRDQPGSKSPSCQSAARKMRETPRWHNGPNMAYTLSQPEVRLQPGTHAAAKSSKSHLNATIQDVYRRRMAHEMLDSSNLLLHQHRAVADTPQMARGRSDYLNGARQALESHMRARNQAGTATGMSRGVDKGLFPGPE